MKMEEILLVDDSYKRLTGNRVKFRKNALGSKKTNNKNKERHWVIFITLFSFILSVFFLFISDSILQDVSSIVAILVVLFIVVIGIIFDIIGIAVTAADEVPFHAMASRKYYGAKKSISLIRNANKVSSICNDVVGDICGIISGTAGAMIVLDITTGKSSTEKLIYSLIMSGFIAAATVGGKAAGKTLAITNSNYIVYKVGVILQFLSGNISKNGKSKKGNKQKEKNNKKHIHDQK